MDEVPFIHRIIDINDNCHILFMHLPDNYVLKSMEFDGFKTKKMGRLNSLNRVKLISHWKKDNGCLVTAFTEILKSRDWDFENHPNPIAIAMVRKEVSNG